jgi:predicted metal-dependent phosphoesterase TrpH
MLDYDLHCHSKFSDGTLTPAELVHRAAGRGVKVMALTDHDDVEGLAEAHDLYQWRRSFCVMAQPHFAYCRPGD